MVNFADIQWLPAKPLDYEAIENSPFNILDEPTILKIFSLLDQPALDNIASTCSLFRRISYDRSLIKDDVETFNKVLPDLLEKYLNNEELLAQFRNLSEESDILPLVLLKQVHWLKSLFRDMPFYVMVDWAPPADLLKGESKSANFLKSSYQALWKGFVAREVKDYHHINLGFQFHDDTFNILLEELVEYGGIPSLGVGEELSTDQVEKLASLIESGQLRVEKFIFCGNPPLNNLKQDRLLQAISRSDSVKEISIMMCNLLDGDMDRIAGLVQGHPSLESISIGGFSFSEQGIGRLLQLYTGETPLSKLCLSGCSSLELECILQEVHGEGLKELSVSCMDLRPETEAAIIQKFNGEKTVGRMSLHYRDYSSRLAFAHIEKSLEASPSYSVEEGNGHTMVMVAQ